MAQGSFWPDEHEPSAVPRDALHFTSMDEDNWGTPPRIIRAAYAAWDGHRPDLDPASDEYRNKTIGAARFLGLKDIDPARGIPVNWGTPARVWINPPGGTYKPAGMRETGLPQLFFAETIQHILRGAQVTWMAYNINQLQTLQSVDADIVARAHVCVPSARVRFVNLDGEEKAGAPSASAILIWNLHPDRLKAFADVGAVWASGRWCELLVDAARRVGAENLSLKSEMTRLVLAHVPCSICGRCGHSGSECEP